MSRALVPNVGAEEGGLAPGRNLPALETSIRLWRLLFPVDARALGESASPPVWPAALGRPSKETAFPWLEAGEAATAWLNTAAAAAEAARSNLVLAGAPPEVVERVHDKAFAQAAASEAGLVPASLRGAVSVFDPEDLADREAAVERILDRAAALPAWARRGCTLKPRFGGSGRGRVATRDGAFDREELASALPRLAARGGALLEPWLERTEDLSALLFVPEAGSPLRLLGTTTQVVSASGVYRGTRGEVDSRGRVFSGSRHDEDLRVAAATVAGAAQRAGYRGPCGVDAFAFRGADEREELRPVVEFNARFTLGIVAVGILRRILPAVRERLGLEPGGRCAFHFALDAPASGWPEPEPGMVFVPLWRDGDATRPALCLASAAAALEAWTAPETRDPAPEPVR